MNAYQALYEEVNRRVDNMQVLDRIVQELVVVERRRLNGILGRGREPEYDSQYAIKMKEYISAKLHAYRQRRNNNSWIYHKSFDATHAHEVEEIVRQARISAMKELDTY